MPLVSTRGAASAQGFGQFAQSAAPVYIEDVFSTWLYTGNGSTQTINNGIDLAGKGGLTWIKRRDAVGNHNLFDTARGATKKLYSDLTNAEFTDAFSLTSFNSNGFSVGIDVNGTDRNYVSWTFREQPKFFDVVTYTGNGTAGRKVAHNLGSVPGCIIVKQTSSANTWRVYHRSLGNTKGLALNETSAETTNNAYWNSTTPTSTEFTVGTNSATNENGQTFVAYLFAHNAGGFGLTGTDNVISCGSFTSNGSGVASVNLGYEPQWILAKQTNGTTAWFVIDNMRGFPVKGTASRFLSPNNSTAENGTLDFSITNTGFDYDGASDAPFIYIAIRRGPMKVPTTGTSVFSPNLQTGGGTVTTNFPVDLIISTTPSQSGSYRTVNDRLRGGSTTRAVDLYTNVTDAETTGTGYGFGFDNNTGYRDAYYSNSFSDIYWNFRRAPGFFDEVCYTGNGTAGRTITHNLTVAPEMMIVKARDFSGGRPWPVYHIGMGNTKFMYLNTTDAEATNTWWNDTTPTASVFTVGSNSVVNFSGTNYVAYLFASCPGVSKVGSYTGNGSSQTINCGFTGGARFVLIKRTDSASAWWVYDTARGIVSGNDPVLLINSTAAEDGSYDTLDPASSGFIVNSDAVGVNTNGGTYIYLAIA